MADQAKSFWSSIQGILTSIAAVITALTGLYIAINGDNVATQIDTNIGTITALPQAVIDNGMIKSDNKSTQPIKQLSQLPTTTPAQKNTPFPETGPLLECAFFPTVNTLTSLMGWSDHYHRQIIAAAGVKRRATEPCNQTIDFRGMAHCKTPDDLEIRQALLETLTLCRAAGIEWQDIQHSSTLGKK